jgi:hypothetical protein
VVRRISNWNAKKRNACLSEFRRMVGGQRREQVENAIEAGRSLAKLLDNAQVTLTGIDDMQMERFRRRYAVVKNLKHVMYAVATGKLTRRMLEQRLNRKFPEYRLPSGRLRLVERCALCSKRTCRCVLPMERKSKQRKSSSCRHALGKVVSVRGVNL